MKINMLAAITLGLWLSGAALAEEFCIYKDERGQMAQVNSSSAVPPQFRAMAKCFQVNSRAKKKGPSENIDNLARPDEINLDGTVRSVQMSSSVGRIKLQWPRNIEKLFGRTPERAMQEAANAISKTLKQNGFPQELRNTYMDWNVVFMDENMPSAQIPLYLRTQCHPGWMTPPANIYIVAQRIAGGCSGKTASHTVSDGKLTETLLHEMGHALEHRLLGGKGSHDPERAEGFATWFEQFAAKQSPVANSAGLTAEHKFLARRKLQYNPNGKFGGTAEDYGYASMYFYSVVSKRGVRGLMDVYEQIKQGRNLRDAVKQQMGWSDKKLSEEMQNSMK